MPKARTLFLNSHHRARALEAVAYSLYKGWRFHYWITIHCTAAGLDMDTVHPFITKYVQHAGNMVDSHEAPRAYMWVLENPFSKGLNCHILFHVPDKGDLRQKFEDNIMRPWVEAAGGKYKRRVVDFELLKGCDADEAAYRLRGLQGTVRYMLKGVSLFDALRLGIDNPEAGKQGEVTGKRFSRSVALSPGRQNWTPAAKRKATDEVRRLFEPAYKAVRLGYRPHGGIGATSAAPTPVKPP